MSSIGEGMTRWTWVWVNSGSWWWTGRPGVLWFMGSRRVGHDWATELNNLEKFTCLDEEIWFKNLFRRAVWALHIHEGPEKLKYSLWSSCQDLSPGARLLQARKKGQLFCNALCFKNSEMCLFLQLFPQRGEIFESTFLLPTSLLSSLQMLSKKFWNICLLNFIFVQYSHVIYFASTNMLF